MSGFASLMPLIIWLYLLIFVQLHVQNISIGLRSQFILTQSDSSLRKILDISLRTAVILTDIFEL